MTIELTTEDLSEILEQTNHYGACILKAKTTDGEDAWIAVQSPRATPRKRTRANSDPANVATQ